MYKFLSFKNYPILLKIRITFNKLLSIIVTKIIFLLYHLKAKYSAYSFIRTSLIRNLTYPDSFSQKNFFFVFKDIFFFFSLLN